MRALGSLGLVLVAVGWGAASIPICFFWLSRIWSVVFGPDVGFWAASAAFLLCMQIARALLAAADSLVEMPGQDDLVPVPEPPDRWGYDWRAYTAELIRMKRWAFYRRTQQFGKLAELEAEERAATQSAAPPTGEDR